MSTKVFITGSNGLLGQKLIDLFKTKKDYDVITTSKGKNRYVHNPFVYIDLDVTDEHKLKKELNFFQPDFIINTAAKTDVDSCEKDKELCDKLNFFSVQYLVDFCEKNNTHLIHISSDFIFDGKDEFYTENNSGNPLNYYGISKLKSENFIKKSTIKYSILRTAIVYGFVHDLNKSNIVLWIKKILESKKEIKIVNDQIRTPTFAEDLALGCFLVIKNKKTGIFNISGKDIMSIYEMVVRIAKFWKLDESLISVISTKELNQKAKRPKKTVLNIEKSSKELGYFPQKFEEALAVIDKQL